MHIFVLNVHETEGFKMLDLLSSTGYRVNLLFRLMCEELQVKYC